jgi:hypothetical protein
MGAESRATLASDMRYWPNPAHKTETTEAGPPLWTPDKDLCPTGMTIAERRDLLGTSGPANEEDPRPGGSPCGGTEHGLGARAHGLPMVFVTEQGHD